MSGGSDYGTCELGFPAERAGSRCCRDRPFVKAASSLTLSLLHHEPCNTQCAHICSLISSQPAGSQYLLSTCPVVSMTSKTNAHTTSLAANNSNRGGRRGMFTRRPGRQRLPGLFADGIWHCDCDCSPRLPAEHFQVRKESPNKGCLPQRPLVRFWLARLILQQADGSILAKTEKAENAACSCGTTMLVHERQRLF